MVQPAGMLLVGPTGSGKTPLGEQMASRGLWGLPCVHFDFGAELRRVASTDRPGGAITAEDVRFVRDVLREGRLLEDEEFPVAERLLRSFLARRAGSSGMLVVLNGLPRHVGQAGAVERIVPVRVVVELSCPAEVVRQRIASNAGGDRAGRADDMAEMVRAKLETYAARTVPLLAHYRGRGVPVFTIPVGVETTARAALERLEAGPWRAECLRRLRG